MSREEIAVDVAFARLELREFECGLRTLTQCPGLKAMAAHIRDAERAVRAEPERPTPAEIAELPGT